jgi:hypothetical protein
MKAKYLKELAEGLADDDEVFYWVTTREDINDRVIDGYENEEPLTDDEFSWFIRSMNADDHLSGEMYQAENYILEKIMEHRKKKEGN